MTTITTPAPADLDHTPGTRLVFGDGAIEHLGQLCVEQSVKRVMIISDPGVTLAGHTGRGLNIVKDAGLEATTFTRVHENPSTADVDEAVKAANEFKPDLLVGLGGGSAIDTAKGCNFIDTNGGVMADYHHKKHPDKPMLPLIAVPTTHGTGSEAQSYALIADEDTHMKMACGDPKALPVIALLDPSLSGKIQHHLADGHAVQNMFGWHNCPVPVLQCHLGPELHLPCDGSHAPQGA